MQETNSAVEKLLSMEKLILDIDNLSEEEILNHVYKRITDTSGMQVWVKDAQMRYIYANELMKEADGLSDVDVVGKVDAELYDRYRIGMFQKLDQQVVDLKEPVQSTYILPKGTFEEVTKFPIFNEAGDVVAIMGFARDVTAERMLNEHTRRLAETEAQFRNVFDNVPIGLAVYDEKSSKPVVMNDKFAKIFRHPKEKLMAMPWQKCAYLGKGNDELIELSKEIIEGKRTSFNVERQIVRGDDSLAWVSVTITEYEPGQNKDRRILCMFEDISDRKSMKAELERLSYTDALTGVYSRSWMVRYLKDSPEMEFPYAMIMGDVNGLKICNDVFGHTEGDKLIKSVASVFEFYAARYDNACAIRLGGDEFLMIIHGIEQDELDLLEQRIKDDVNDMSTEYLDYSVALGSVIAHQGDFADFESTMLAAEEKMYASKISESRNLGDKVVNRALEIIKKEPLESSHMQNVAYYARELCKALKLGKDLSDDIVTAAKLHDIGMIACESQREAPGKPILLDDEQGINVIKKHAEVGYRLVHYSKTYSHLAEYILHHHENVDGTGYPAGICEEDIPIPSRIIAIADNYDALTNPRFGKDLTDDQVLETLRAMEGTEIDEEYTEIFINEVVMKD